MKSLRRIGRSRGRARLAQVGERAAEVRLLGEDRDAPPRRRARRRARSRRSSRPRGSSPPTASGACARRSATCRGATAPRRTGRPSRPTSTSRSSSDSGRSRLRAVDAPRAWRSTRSSRRGAHARVSARRSARARRARRPSRSPPRRARTPSASESARPAHVDRGAGVQHRQRRARCPAPPSSTAAQERARSRPGVPAPTAPSVRRLEPDLLGASRRRCRCRRRSARPRGSAPRPRTRRGHPRSTLPMPSRVPSSPSARRHRLQLCPGRDTPITWRRAPAGLVSGPRKLKIVRTAERLAHRHHVLHRRVVERREHEAEAHLVDAVRHRGRARGRCARRAPRARRPSRTGWWPSGCRAWPRGSPRRRR